MKQDTQELKPKLIDAVNQEFPNLALNKVIIGVPGGNPTAIFDITDQLPSQEVRTRLNNMAMELIKGVEIEQVGFLFVNGDGEVEFSMAGNEACVNATRLAGLLIGNRRFRSSGFDKPVLVNTDGNGETYLITDNPIKQVNKYGDKILVDLGGIVQIVDLLGEREAEGISEQEINDLKERTKQLIQSDSNLQSKPAVGLMNVYNLPSGETILLPVVWVNSIDTLIFETACGSGSIATLEAMRYKGSQTNQIRLLQPSGMYLSVQRRFEQVIVKSKVQIL